MVVRITTRVCVFNDDFHCIKLINTAACEDYTEPLSNESRKSGKISQRRSFLGRSRDSFVLRLFQAATEEKGKDQSATSTSMEKLGTSKTISCWGSEEKKARKSGSCLGRGRRSFLKSKKSRAESEVTQKMSSQWDKDNIFDDEEESTHHALVTDLDTSSSSPDSSSADDCIYEDLRGAGERSDPAVYGFKESHPMFDGRFIEVDGLISLDTLWQERRQSGPSARRGGRRPRSNKSA